MLPLACSSMYLESVITPPGTGGAFVSTGASVVAIDTRVRASRCADEAVAAAGTRQLAGATKASLQVSKQSQEETAKIFMRHVGSKLAFMCPSLKRQVGILHKVLLIEATLAVRMYRKSTDCHADNQKSSLCLLLETHAKQPLKDKAITESEQTSFVKADPGKLAAARRRLLRRYMHTWSFCNNLLSTIYFVKAYLVPTRATPDATTKAAFMMMSLRSPLS